MSFSCLFPSSVRIDVCTTLRDHENFDWRVVLDDHPHTKRIHVLSGCAGTEEEAWDAAYAALGTWKRGDGFPSAADWLAPGAVEVAEEVHRGRTRRVGGSTYLS